MAVIHIPRKHLIQPQGRATAVSGNVDFVLHGGGITMVGNRGFASLDQNSWTSTTSPHGLCIGPKANVYINTNIPAKEIWGAVLAIDVRVADITASVQGHPLVSAGSNGFFFGAQTSYLTGETLSVQSDGLKRSGVATPLPRGPHVIVLQWTGSRYEIWVDGELPEQLTGNSGEGDAGLVTISPVLGGRLYSSTPHIFWSLAAFTGPDTDAREYVSAPWQLFCADPIRIYSLPSGPIVPLSVHVAASNITSSGARITATLGF